MIATIPAYFGKFSLAWPALITLISNKELRTKFTAKTENELNRTRVAIIFRRN
jgi:hypothetical protein